ncbi:hypothetical protein FBU30_007445 [Linnemannia zychae]|nr:hypothetical protein FBU30_007445 [Linnemannia zychae]
MGQYEFDGCYIPPVEELNASFQMESEDVESATSFSSGRPRWTWDWHLPLLTSLTLTAELNGMDAVCVKGYTLGKLVSLLKAIPNNLAEISLRFSPDEPTKDEARKIGMLPENDIDKERLDLLMKEGRLVNVDMDWSRFYVIKPSES